MHGKSSASASSDAATSRPAYLRLAPLFKGLEVRAVADMNMDGGEGARGGVQRTKAQSVDDLLANPAVDVVINLTIPDAHYAVDEGVSSRRESTPIPKSRWS
jgi:predicted dehydrogenase